VRVVDPKPPAFPLPIAGGRCEKRMNREKA
jgi:hypothetical protein